MRRTIGLMLLLLTASMPTWAEGSELQIVEIYSNPDGDREFIELWNPGPAVDMQGLQIRDAVGNTFTFPAWHVEDGGRVVVWGGGESNAQGPAWSKASVWNNGGDTAQLIRDGQVIQEVSFGAITKGQSLAWQDGWIEGTPTPGAAPGQQNYGASATVEDVAPHVQLDVPEEVQPNAVFDAVIAVDDDNGDEVTWELWRGDALLATDNTNAATVALTAPSRGELTVTLTAWDSKGNTANVEAVVSVESPALQVELPAGGVTFPSMKPGDEGVTSNTFTMHNGGSFEVTPRIDVSPFSGPETWDVEGRLQIAIDGTWLDYEGPMMQLPPVAPGTTVALQFRVDVPKPLAAGDYGTSFTVMA